jgi:hypothetical protein
VVLIVMCWRCQVSAQGEPCRARSRYIVSEIKKVQDWNTFHNSFERFGSCDRARIAEEFSYAISRLLTQHWGDADVLVRLAAEDTAFKAFILRHIDENIPEEEGQLIVRNCREHPPVNGEWLCKAVVDY